MNLTLSFIYTCILSYLVKFYFEVNLNVLYIELIYMNAWVPIRIHPGFLYGSWRSYMTIIYIYIVFVYC